VPPSTSLRATATGPYRATRELDASAPGERPAPRSRSPQRSGCDRSPVELRDRAAVDSHLARARIARYPQGVGTGRKVIEHGRERRTTIDAPLEHLLVAAATVVA